MRVVEVYSTDISNSTCLPGFEYTGEVIKIGYEACKNEEIIRTFYVLRGVRTPQFEVRDCVDHYIKANYSTFDYINKKTLEIIKDVEDE